MNRNYLFGIAAVVICISAIVKVMHWPFANIADIAMRIALISGIVFLVVDKYRSDQKKKQ